MINYLLEMFSCQVLFLGLYQAFKSEPFFRINRFYLLLSLILSLVFPLINFGNVESLAINYTYIEWLQPIQIGAEGFGQDTTSLLANEQSSGFQWNWYPFVYAVGLLVYLSWFFIQNRSVFKYLKLSTQKHYRNKNLVMLPNSTLAFSFWNRIYLGENIPESQREVILEHEYHHLKQKHSWDVLLVEILQGLFWFNPLLFIYKKDLRQIHEFEADRLATRQTPKQSYINTLLNQSFGSRNISFINSFYNSSNLKKRIKMLQHAKSSNLKKLKYLLILPIIVLAILVSCSQDEVSKAELTQEEKAELLMPFIDELFNTEPSFFQVIKEKPNLKKLFNHYNIKIEDNYSELEEGKVALLLKLVTSTTKNEKDKTYKNQIFADINNSKGLKAIYEKLQEKMENKTIEMQTEYQELDPHDEIPFSALEQVPHPSSCSGKTGKELKKCVSQFISNHVNTNFDTGIGEELGLSGKTRIVAQFKIDKNGNIVDLKTRAPHPKLEQEAQRVIKTLPQMIPGQADGENVSVLYGLPINFVMQ